MAKKETQNALCKSVFKDGKNTVTKSIFTKKWIELINTLEKEKV